ncbi:MAG: D-alanyl-D-alanine carboxypeptidase [Lentisphaeria bacterium]|nr:D-alanyl-D-alanine carboxypeptidase [Lentisphaeria bacterium]
MLKYTLILISLHAYADSARLNSIFQHKDFKQSTWSCQITNLKSNTVIYQFNADKALVPASNQKIVIALAALLHHGANYQASSDFYYSGTVNEGSLAGDLIVKGNGAHVFTGRFATTQIKQAMEISRKVKVLCDALKKAGITEISGSIILHNSDYSGSFVNSHYPAASPTLFNDNSIDVIINNSKLRIQPAINTIEIKYGSFAWKQKRSKKILYINRSKDSQDYWRVESKPDHFYIKNLKYYMTLYGIKILDEDFKATEINELISIKGLSIAEQLPAILSRSDNLRAETMALHLAWSKCKRANYSLLNRAVHQILIENKLQLDSLNAADGSGLSRKNKMSAADMSQLLSFILQSKFREQFMKNLAVSGEKGTLTNYLKNLKGRIIAKTGTLNGVKSISGYIVDEKKMPSHSFSFIVNNSPSSTRCWKAFADALSEIAN